MAGSADSLIFWPPALCPAKIAINPKAVSVRGPTSLSGFRQSVVSPAGVWSIKYVDIPLIKEKINLWRAIAAQAEGSSGVLVVPAYDYSVLSLPGETGLLEATHDDTTTFSDGSSYVSDATQVVALAAASAGSTAVNVVVICGGTITPGMYFSIGYNLYIVKKLEQLTSTGYTLHFWPMARIDIVAGTELRFSTPVCKVQLANDDSMPLEIELGCHAHPSVEFVEVPY